MAAKKKTTRTMLMSASGDLYAYARQLEGDPRFKKVEVDADGNIVSEEDKQPVSMTGNASSGAQSQ